MESDKQQSLFAEALDYIGRLPFWQYVLFTAGIAYIWEHFL